MIGLLLDAGLPRGAAADLRADGWDVQHVADCGLGAAKDGDIVLAKREGRAVVTLDHDFPHLLFLEGAASAYRSSCRSWESRRWVVSWPIWLIPLTQSQTQ